MSESKRGGWTPGEAAYPIAFTRVRAHGAAGGWARGAEVFCTVDGHADTVESVRLLVEAAPEMAECLREYVAMSEAQDADMPDELPPGEFELLERARSLLARLEGRQG